MQNTSGAPDVRRTILKRLVDFDLTARQRIAEALDISYDTLCRKINGTSHVDGRAGAKFTRAELLAVSIILSLPSIRPEMPILQPLADVELERAA
jgi:hypothetical protein